MAAASFLFTSVFVLFIGITGAERKVTTSLIKCTGSKKCGDITVGHIEAAGSDDVIHYLLSTVGLPTVFVAVTSVDSKPSINWSGFLSDQAISRAKSITFSPGFVHDSFTVIFTKLIEYNDTKDYADMTKYSQDSTSWNTYPLDEMSWLSLKDVSDPTGNKIMFEAARETFPELWEKNGTLSIQVMAYKEAGREDKLPHLQYNENITQFDLNVDNLSSNLSSSRFALEIMMIGNDTTNMYIQSTQSIDDEYTPGVFKIFNWVSRSNLQSKTGFLQWKPVCYQALERARDKATGMNHYGLVGTPSPIPAINHTLAFGYYGGELTGLMTQMQNFSFGLAKDGGYNKTGVLTWSGSIGYGEAPVDSISTLVIIIISAGLGLPVVIIIFGGIFVCVKKRQNRDPKPLQHIQRDDYQPLANDD